MTIKSALELRPKRQSQRSAPLDGIRGLAIAAVILYHFLPDVFRGGSYGVLVFFVLSGYLITSLLLREHDKRGRIDMKAFYARRALRLLPALYAFLAVTIVIAFIAGETFGFTTRGTLVGAGMAFFYVFNWASFVALQIPHAMTPLWTLSVEEQFYLVWPLVLIGILKIGALRRRILPVVLGTSALFWLIGVVGFAVLGVTSYYRTWTWISTLLIGVAIAVARHYGNGNALSALARFTPAAWILLAAALFLPSLNDTLIAYAVTIPLLGACAASVILASSTGLSASILSSRALVYLGRRSYGLYLWNLVSFEVSQRIISNQFLAVVTALLGTFLIAEVSYRFIEQPALKLKHRFERAQAI